MSTTARHTASNNTSTSHPNPVDRNRSIIWARYLIDSDDWVMLASKVTRTDSTAIISFAVLDSTGKVVTELMVKPTDIVPNELIAQHALDYGVVFHAEPYPEIRQQLIEALKNRQVLSWNFDRQRTLLEKLDKQHGLATHDWLGNSVSHQFARFTGEKTDESGGYKMQKLRVNGLSARDECLAIRKLIVSMASTSQASDPLVSGKQGWTAQMYRPKLSPADKLRSFFHRS